MINRVIEDQDKYRQRIKGMEDTVLYTPYESLD